MFRDTRVSSSSGTDDASSNTYLGRISPLSSSRHANHDKHFCPQREYVAVNTNETIQIMTILSIFSYCSLD